MTVLHGCQNRFAIGGELVIDERGDSTTMRGPAEYMRPCALDVSHLRAGVEPLVEMVGPVVLAGGEIRREENRG